MSKPENCDEKTAKLLQEQTKKYNSMMTNNETNELLGNFLKQTAEFIGCGPECQKNNASDRSLQKYQEAQMSLFDGPMKLEDTSKTYYTVSQGEDYYDDFMEQKLNDVANKIGNTYLEVFDGIVETSKNLSDLYEANLVNYRNSQKLDEEYNHQAKDVSDLLVKTQGDANTDDRKTYYENQELDNLKYWYKWYYYIYIIIVITYVLSMFLVGSTVSFRIQIIVLIIFVLWFFFGDKVLRFGINFVKDLLGLIPKNVYLTL